MKIRSTLKTLLCHHYLDFECDHGDQIIGARSQSSADLVRGISITTEQSGGENTSSTTFLSTDINVYQSNKPGIGDFSTLKHFRSGDSPQTETARRRISLNRWMRSEDVVVPIDMNSGREDLFGINPDNIPMPERNASKVRKHYPWSNNSSSLFTSVDAKSTWDASSRRAIRYSAGDSMMAPLHNTAGQSAAQQLPHQFTQFGYSDSAIGLPHSSSHNNSSVRYASNNVGTKIPMNTLNQASVSWLPSHPMSNHGSDDSDFSSGTSVSCTCSSYTSNCQSSTEIDAGFRRSPEYCNVKFKSPYQEDDTKFDKVIRRVESVLDKPCELSLHIIFIVDSVKQN